MVCIQCGKTFEMTVQEHKEDEEGDEAEAMLCPYCGGELTD